MIICVSANPAIDKRLMIDELRVGEVNRTNSVTPFAGGKAAHVAMAAKALGEDVIWIGLLGGESGNEIARQLRDLGIGVVAIPTRSATRTNLEIIARDGKITEILEPGGAVESAELGKFRDVFSDIVGKTGEEAIVALSGSLPPGMPVDEYYALTSSAKKAGAKVIVDASGPALTAALAGRPDLIKPNRSEAESATGISIENPVDAIAAVRELKERGAGAVALTLGADGLMFCRDVEARSFVRPPKSRLSRRSAAATQQWRALPWR
ncbi:MAG: 1-phosphofructokinase [Acidobacteria bacterium OLB17]|nr:MAG: 1-phosphofructokinase [Acidobacteria bacterium OLB17]